MTIQYYPHLLGVSGNAYYTIILPQRVCVMVGNVCLQFVYGICQLSFTTLNTDTIFNICGLFFTHPLTFSLTLVWVGNLYTKLLQIPPARNIHGLHHVPFHTQKMS